MVRETFAAKNDKGRCCCCQIKAMQGMFNWFRILWSLSDEKLIEINGIDYTLYLVFLRYVSYFFAGLTLFNMVCCEPIYMTGSPTPNEDGTSSLNTTMD